MNIETYEKQLETRNYNVGAALSKLAPGTSWAVEGNTYAGIIWNSDESLKPSEEAVEAEMVRGEELLQADEQTQAQPVMAEISGDRIKPDLTEVIEPTEE
jgi:hypothetical protein